MATDACIELTDLEPGVIYNVPQGVWHNLVATEDASWIIVENRDTHLRDTETRQMTDTERRQVLTQLPDWSGKTEG